MRISILRSLWLSSFVVVAVAFGVMAQVPAAPTLLTPANAATGIAVTPALTWNTVALATSYQVEVSTAATFATTVWDDSGLTAGKDSITTALANGTTYYWRVNAKDSTGSSAWSGARTFTTIVLTPAVPTLLTPANGATGIAVTPALTWNTVANATSYQVEVSTVNTFATTVWDDSGLTAGKDSITTALANGTTYYWRVNAKNTYGSSAYSAARNFTTVTLTPAVPTLLTPANAATGIAVTPALTWNTVANATSYQVEVSTVNTFATTVWDDSGLTAGKDSVTTALANGTTYYWRVNAKNSYGSSAYSAARNFTTVTLTPAAPTLLTPANAATGIAVTPALTWNTVANATSYQVEVSTVNTFATTVWDDSGLTAGKDSVTTALANGTTYYWRVNAKNSYGSSAYSSARTFTTVTLTPAAPTLLTPANGATGIAVTPALTWNTVANATSYQVEVSTVNTFATTVWDDSGLTAGKDSITTALANGTIYYWRVNAKNTYGSSAWSAMNNFTTVTLTPAAPTLLTPANGATGIALTPALTWNTIANATSYQVEVSTIATFATTVWDDSGLTAGKDSVTTALANGTTYYWRVNAKNTYGSSAYSAARNFTTLTLIPAVPTLLTPANGATGIAITPALTWNTISNATSYQVEVSTAATFATLVWDDSTPTAGTDSITTSLANGTVYYWRVNAKNSYGSSAYSAARNFTTITLLPAAPTLLTPANAATGIAVTPALTWNTIANATSYQVEVSTVATFATTVWDDSGLTAGKDSVTTALANGTTYYWRANAKNTYGSSAYSAARTFTTVTLTPAAPTLLTPANAATGIALTPALTWNTVANATSYQVEVSTVATFATTVWDDSGLTAGKDSITTALANGTTYYWRANAKNTYGSSAYSAARTFTTLTATPPVAPTLLTPANAATVSIATPTLTWGTVAGAATYRLEVSTANTFATTVVNDSVLTVGSFTFPATLANGTYYWRVNAKNANGTSAWSAAWSFTQNVNGIIAGNTHFAASAGRNGVLEVYMANGKRVLETAFDLTGPADLMLRSSMRGLARGFYSYRLRVDSKVVGEGCVINR